MLASYYLVLTLNTARLTPTQCLPPLSAQTTEAYTPPITDPPSGSTGTGTR